MKKGSISVLLWGFVVLFDGCLSDEEPGFLVFSNFFDFSQSQYGWTGDFSDYPGEDSALYELQFEYANLPSNLDNSKKALKLSGFNYSDDLFMFVTKKLTGFHPNTEYNIVFEIEFASEAPTGSVGAGGSPGESVYLKAGAVPFEPKKVLEGSMYLMNIDKGNQSQGGKDMIVLGNIAVDAFTNSYTIIERSNSIQTTSYLAKSSSNGELWLIIGTDSGFEGLTTLYYTRVNVVFSVSN